MYTILKLLKCFLGSSWYNACLLNILLTMGNTFLKATRSRDLGQGLITVLFMKRIPMLQKRSTTSFVSIWLRMSTITEPFVCNFLFCGCRLPFYNRLINKCISTYYLAVFSILDRSLLNHTVKMPILKLLSVSYKIVLIANTFEFYISYAFL